MKLAIISDDLTQFGGQENLLLALLEIYPNAPLYTSVLSDEWLQILKKKNVSVKHGFLQYFPLREKLNRFYAAFGLHTLIYENLDLSEYDVVLSISSRFSHGVITKPHCIHICYMNTPGRFWETHAYLEHDLSSANLAVNLAKKILYKLLSPLLFLHKLSDSSKAQRVDYFIANSKTPAKRIQKYFSRESEIIYPFIEWEKYQQALSDYVDKNNSEYFLVISRLVSWKNIQVAIQACENLQKKLVIVGQGPDLKRLHTYAKGNTTFTGYIPFEEKKRLLANCTALIQTQDEDFGLTPLEAVACGKPAIAFGKGGALETIIPGVTGEFFDDQTCEALQELLTDFDPSKYSYQKCISHAKNFKKEIFVDKIRAFVDSVYLKRH